MALFSKNYPPEIAQRIPPGQRLVKTWPVLHYGPIPTFDGQNWDLELTGLVENPVTLSYQELRALPNVDVAADMHCVTGWTTLDNTWHGVSFRTLERAREADARGEVGDRPLRVRLHVEPLARGDGRRRRPRRVGERGTRTSSREHGWPLRLVVPKRYAWKSAKWLTGLRVRRQEQARVLGGARVPHPRRAVRRGALLLPGGPAGRARALALAQASQGGDVGPLAVDIAGRLEDPRDRAEQRIVRRAPATLRRRSGRRRCRRGGRGGRRARTPSRWRGRGRASRRALVHAARRRGADAVRLVDRHAGGEEMRRVEHEPEAVVGDLREEFLGLAGERCDGASRPRHQLRQHMRPCRPPARRPGSSPRRPAGPLRGPAGRPRPRAPRADPRRARRTPGRSRAAAHASAGASSDPTTRRSRRRRGGRRRGEPGAAEGARGTARSAASS